LSLLGIEMRLSCSFPVTVLAACPGTKLVAIWSLVVSEFHIFIARKRSREDLFLLKEKIPFRP
jgi:hypothetical protein